VIVDGKRLFACQMMVSQAAGKKITTVEGLAKGEELHPVQRAFMEEMAFQCGYCTPGMIMGAVALLEQCPAPTEADIVAAMQGHICRCGTYRRIIRAIQQVAADPARAEPEVGR
jgi:aerobic-type carbon monoxide dehydrogenase small subunit (CoxS/CutS family)